MVLGMNILSLMSVGVAIGFFIYFMRSSRKKRRTAHLSKLGKAVPRILTPAGHDAGITTPKHTKKPRMELD